MTASEFRGDVLKDAVQMSEEDQELVLQVIANHLPEELVDLRVVHLAGLMKRIQQLDLAFELISKEYERVEQRNKGLNQRYNDLCTELTFEAENGYVYKLVDRATGPSPSPECTSNMIWMRRLAPDPHRAAAPGLWMVTGCVCHCDRDGKVY